MIGKLPEETKAKAFGGYLCAVDVENEVERDDDGKWLVWVMDEADFERSRAALARFEEDPGQAEFRVTRSAPKTAIKAARKNASATRVYRRGDLFASMRPYHAGPLTVGIVVVCVALAFITEFGNDLGRAGILYIAEIKQIGGRVEWYRGLVEVRRGEIWRLVTPIFLHGDFFHLLFNMMWFWGFGALIEARKSTTYLGLLVLVSAALSNLLQFRFEGAYFSGMSGVNYALFGFLWIKGRYDPGSGMGVHPHSAILLMVWFFLCISGAVGHVANWCHAGGLVVGGVWGLVTTRGAFSRLLNRD